MQSYQSTKWESFAQLGEPVRRSSPFQSNDFEAVQLFQLFII